MSPMHLHLLLLISCQITGLLSFSTIRQVKTISSHALSNIQLSRTRCGAKSSSETSEEYRDPVTKFLGAFISKEKSEDKLSLIDWNKPKRKKVPLVSLAKTLEVELTKKEWFVNGNVDASFFSDDFTFQDPDVKIKGIEEYARGVNKIFSQKNARAEIIAVRKNEEAENTLTVTWRLSGSVNLGPGLQIKPFIVLTDFVVSPSDGLIVFQEDRFSLPGSDIVLSAFFPFLIEKFLLPPAQPADILKAEFLEKERELMKASSSGSGGNPLDSFMKIFKK
jgi:Uncharacterized conserved protein (DUF2358)